MRAFIKAVVRILIIIGLMSLLNTLINFILPPASVSTDIFFWILIAIVVLLGIGLVLLWRKSDWVVNVIAGEFSDNEVVITTSKTEFIRVFMFLFGIALIFISVPKLLGLVGYQLSFPSEFAESYAPLLKSEAIREWISTAVSLIIGFWLVFGNRTVIKNINFLINDNFVLESEDEDKTSSTNT